ncbi:hypothetical protein [Pseudomonas fluorescens]|nr:hypothetical protein [Pseudomonas fluorescens]
MQIADQQDNKRFETALRPSRAGSLPQGIAFQGGSEPAREEAGKANKRATAKTAAMAWCAKM